MYSGINPIKTLIEKSYFKKLVYSKLPNSGTKIFAKNDHFCKYKNSQYRRLLFGSYIGLDIIEIFMNKPHFGLLYTKKIEVIIAKWFSDEGCLFHEC